jgi:hypothetical protein
MNIQSYIERFHPGMDAHPEFVVQMKAIDNRLDCVFNTLEKCWMIISWENASEWHWVMSCRDHETGARYLPCSFVLDRLRELKTKWQTGDMLKEIDKAENQAEASRISENDDWAHELAKDLRKTLINDMDGVVSTLNPFI